MPVVVVGLSIYVGVALVGIGSAILKDGGNWLDKATGTGALCAAGGCGLLIVNFI